MSANIRRSFFGLLLAAALLFITVCVPGTASSNRSSAPAVAPNSVAAAKARAQLEYAKLPLAFERNDGQADRRVKFLSRGRGYTMFLTPSDAVLVLTKRHPGSNFAPPSGGGSAGHGASLQAKQPTVDAIPVRMRIVGGNSRAHVEGEDRLSGTTNYFIGNDPKRWRTGVPNFAKVRYSDVYRGIDLVFYGNPSQFEYDFVVSPKARPKDIRLAFAGMQKLEVDSDGDLVISAGGEKLLLRKPAVYQDGKGGRKGVAGEFALLDSSTVGFMVGDYDHSRPLVIDPTLVFAKIIPGNFLDLPNKVAVDANNNPYIAGLTCSSDYPATKVAGPRTGCDAFVTKLDASTAAVDYSTILGGSGFDEAFGVAVDQAGAAYVAGETFSSDFAGGSGLVGFEDAFVAKLNSDGTLAWSRLIGGSNPINGGALGTGWTVGFTVAIPQGCSSSCPVLVAGQSTVRDLPVANAFQSSPQSPFADAFLGELSGDSTTIQYLTYFGGGPTSIPGQGGSTWFFGLAADGSGKAYAAGGADLETVPFTTGNAFGGTADAIVAEFDPSQSGAGSLLWARYLGGSGYDEAFSIALDPGCASNCPSYVGGVTYSQDFPTTAGAYQTNFGGNTDAFVVKLNSSGGVTYSSYVGDLATDSAHDISVDTTGSPYIIGTSEEAYPSASPIEGPQPPNGILLKSTDGGVSFGATGYAAGNSAVDCAMNCLATAPSNSNTMYIGSTRSGLLTSTNAGGSFGPLGTATTGIAGFALDPNNPSIIYRATLSGFEKSTDGGNTFTATPIALPATASAVDPDDSSHVYVGTGVFHGAPAAGQVFQSTDGAASFAAMPGLSATQVGGLAVDPNDDTLYAATSRGLFHASHFAPTGNLNTAREFNAIALLNDGRALVVGGDVGPNTGQTASAETYDPSTGTWTPTGNLNFARVFPTATTLGNGKVLIAGGFFGCAPSCSETVAELYDPVAGSFSTTGSLTYFRHFHTATLLQNGLVLIAGGDSQVAELYNASSGTFSTTGTMTSVRFGATATLLSDGRVLLAGGTDASNNILSSAEIYDPVSGTFSATGSMSVPRELHTANLLPSGSVLIAGGTDTVPFDPGTLASAEVYNPSNGTFSVTGSLHLARNGASATSLPDGRILIVGGTHFPSDPGRTSELYDPVSGTFSLAGTLTDRFVASGIVLLQNGNVLNAGGNTGPSLPPLASAELYDPNSFGFQQVGPRYTFVDVLAVDSTTIPSTVYAGIVNGVVESNSGFSGWNYAANTLLPQVDSLAVDLSTTPGKLYAGDANGELITSTDGGNTISVQNILAFNPGPVLALATPSNGSGTVYAAPFEEFDATVSQLSPDFSTLPFSSFLGGTYGDFGNGLAVGPTGNAYLVGGTASPDFPDAANELKGRDNVFVAMIGNTSTGTNVSVEPCNNCLVTFPTVNSGGNTVASTSAVGPALPAGFQLSGGGFTNISTTSSVTASSANPITVCFDYANSGVTDPSNLSLLHYQDGAWVNVTTSNDQTHMIICGAVTTLSPFAIVEGKPIGVQIMIKPPSAAPVSLNLGSNGVIPVAILSTTTFDATTVNPATINLEGASVRLKGNGGFQCSASDVNGDGIKDLVCQVPTNQFQLVPGSDVAVLTAETNGNRPIQGQEVITVVPQ